jgi:serine/threonine protein kinase
VAVKIIEFTLEPGQATPLEGLLGQAVNHPSVVTTYKHATRTVEVLQDDLDLDEPPPTASSSSAANASAHSSTNAADGGSGRAPFGAAGDSGNGAARARKQLVEAYLLLEMCNRGCVSDAVEKGWFRAAPPPAPPSSPATAGADGGEGSSTASSSFQGVAPYAPNIPAILATAREVASAMAYLHSKQMLHGDLTGNNVLLTSAPSEARGFTAKVCAVARTGAVAVSACLLARLLAAPHLLLLPRPPRPAPPRRAAPRRARFRISGCRASSATTRPSSRRARTAP